MFNHVIANSFDDFFSNLTQRGGKNVYFYRINDYAQTVNNLITKFDLIKRKKKTAIMLPTLKLIEKTKESMEDLYPNIEIGTFIGSIAKDKRAAELSKQFILTNDKIFDKGIDVSDLEILINFVPIGSLVKTEQIMGRLRYHEGKSSILIDITDIGFDECVRQSKIRKRFYNSNG